MMRRRLFLFVCFFFVRFFSRLGSVWVVAAVAAAAFPPGARARWAWSPPAGLRAWLQAEGDAGAARADAHGRTALRLPRLPQALPPAVAPGAAHAHPFGRAAIPVHLLRQGPCRISPQTTASLLTQPNLTQPDLTLPNLT